MFASINGQMALASSFSSHCLYCWLGLCPRPPPRPCWGSL